MDDRGPRRFSEVVPILRTPFFWVCLVTGVLGVLAYYTAFFPPNPRDLAAQSEQFLFEANQAAGAPVLLLSAWLFYRRAHFRDVLRGPGTIAAGSIAISLAAGIYAWGAFTTSRDIELTSIIPLLVGIVLLLGGRAGLRAYWLPIFFLVFALPISPVFLAATIFPTQLVTAEFSGLILNAMGFNAYVVGDQILRPENTFVVIETCSGFRTIVTLSMLTILLIDLFERRGWHAVVLIALAPLVAFVVNALRVVTLVLNPASSIHSIHNLQGIVMLLVGLVVFYLFDGGLERALGSRDPDATMADYGLMHSGGAPPNQNTLHMLGVAALLLAMVGFGHFGPKWELARRSLDEKPGDLLMRIYGRDPDAPFQTDYNFAGSVVYLDHGWQRVDISNALVSVHLGVADGQLRGHSILSKRLAWPATGFSAIAESFVEIEPGGPVARRMMFRRGARTVLSYSWIEGRGGPAEEWFRHAVALDRSPFARADPMLAIRLTADVGVEGGVRSLAAAEERIRRAWNLLAPELDGYARVQAAH